jgi:MYXO-CTERM domain-containing protein
VFEPLGSSCTGPCPGAYVCWAASGKPPGICVPACTAQQSTCPTDYACDTELGACLRTADLPPPKLKQGGGCSVAQPGAAGRRPGGAWLALLGLAAAWRGRHARRATRRANGI